MKDKRQKDLLDKIAKALQRRAQLGLPRHIKPAIPKITNKVQVKMGQLKRPAKCAISRNFGASIFLSGSIGDVIALETFLTEEERQTLPKIYYATKKEQEIKTLFQSLPNYPKLKEHVSVWQDFGNIWCFYSKDECINKINSSKKPMPLDLVGAKDFSIMSRFVEFMNGTISYNGSSFIKHNVADISSMLLPESYVVVCPFSSDKRMKGRDFDENDWENCLIYLKKLGKKGVVLSDCEEKIPASEFLVDFSNQTTITEAIEIVKAAEGYVGIDSSMSVVASKIFKYPRLLIKSINPHCYQFGKCYYAPQTDFRFLTKSIGVPADISAPTIPRLNKGEQRSITLNVCQGIGDIFWVYQKFAPHVDGINFCIAKTPGVSAKLQTRSMDFLRLLPKVNQITTKEVSDRTYTNLVAGKFELPEILDRFRNNKGYVFDYSCNKPLEDGIRIEDIDPDYPIEESVPMTIQPMPFDFGPKRYVTVYLSGSIADDNLAKRAQLWSPGTWREFIKKFYLKYGLDVPVLLIGASYDQFAANTLAGQLKQDGFKTKTHIDALPGNVAFLLQNSLVFLGYQSGLNVLADNMDVKQVMLYFPFLNKMLYSWCKNKNINDGTFNASTFDKKPQEVLDGLRLSL